MVDAGIWPDDNTQHVFLIDPKFTKNTTQTVTIHILHIQRHPKD